ncbi:MAG: glycoside hydrolase family 38 C-terminal domain-containing protein [Hespellia sp.]|nr:glycoside hydrolase family 38 C-terminal domain-containing protein [Hespellia sp.]
MEKKGYVVTHTHWDREWRYPIWESRIYLAEMLDELLETLEEHPEYTGFLFDGQSVFLEDYLEIRPENRERLTKQIQDKRILIGPWYTLPDLYPVSGESLVRNLLKGDRVCRAFGHKLNIGYESFGWGQPSQFPQIYKGFGMDLIIVAKRVSERRAPESEFIWEGKDGTRMLTTRLGKEARANFYMNTYMEAMSGRAYQSDEFRYEYGGTRLYHKADKTGSEQDFFMLNRREFVHEEKLKELALCSWDAVEATHLKEDRILMDGSDSTCAQTMLPELIQKINSALKEEEITLHHASIEEYAQVLKEKLEGKDLRVIKGELRDGPAPSVSANALMTRYPVKKLHKNAENSLMNVAEPLAVFGFLSGLPYHRRYLEKARDYLLGSQSHDSINGVVQDKTVRDVMYRLDQCVEISSCVSDQVLRYFAAHIKKENVTEQDILLLLVNPLPKERTEVLELVIDTPREQNIWDFDLYDMKGKKLECAHISRKEMVTPTVNRHTRPEPFYADRHEVILNSGEIPAGGYKVVCVRPKEHFEREKKFWPPTRMSDGTELSRAANVMENRYLKITVQPNGSVKILEKETGYETGELNYLEDGGDIGDYWIHFPPYHNQIYTSQGVQANIWMEENTPLQTSICAAYDFVVPAAGIRPEAGIQGESARSKELVSMPVEVRYILKKNARKLDVKLRVKNTARDHRLAVYFHTDIMAETADAGGHFTVDHRNVRADQEDDGMRYPEMDSLPMQNFVDVSDDSRGFGVISDQLLEYNASIPGYLSCTLFRAVRDIICTEFRSGSSYPSQEGGQILEAMEYEYALMPHRGDWEESKIVEHSRMKAVPVLAAQFSVDAERSGVLAMEKSFLQVEGAEISCVKFAEDNEKLILRIYNPRTENRAVRVSLAEPVETCFEVNMNEERIGALIGDEHGFTVELKPDEIKTIEVTMKEAAKKIGDSL